MAYDYYVNAHKAADDGCCADVEGVWLVLVMWFDIACATSTMLLARLLMIMMLMSPRVNSCGAGDDTHDCRTGPVINIIMIMCRHL